MSQWDYANKKNLKKIILNRNYKIFNVRLKCKQMCIAVVW